MGNFQCRVRIINGLFAPGYFGSSGQQTRTKKGRRKAGLFSILGTQVAQKSVLRYGWAAEPVVEAGGNDIDVLADAALG